MRVRGMRREERSSRVRSAALALAIATLAPLAVTTQDEPAHRGPGVADGASGPARFVAALFEAFDAERALATVRFADGYYRAPANAGYEATLDRVAELLRAAGFGEREGFELELLASEEPELAWTPRSARLELLLEGDAPRRLHGFDGPAERDRTMLPVNAPSADVSGPVALDLDSAPAGSVLVTRQGLGGGLLRRAKSRGLAAVISSSLEEFNGDPTGAERHLDAIQFTHVPKGTELPVAQVSARTQELIETLCASGRAPRLALRAEVEFEERPLRTLVATLVGSTRAGEAVAIASHVQEPGANDNASGVGGLCEAACALAKLVGSKAIERPARSIVFLWGDEFRQSSSWLDATKLRAIAGISADMLGESRDRTGALPLLERLPDPGALRPLPPDEHTPWGAGPVSEKDLSPNALALVARTALADVARRAGGWHTAENPWEGGSDHDVFLHRVVPAVLFWHFTDFAYHTSLDRMELVDGEELRRTCVAVLATALAVADAREGDLERYLASLELERALRVGAAQSAGDDELAARWESWCDGAALWLRELCGAPEPAKSR